MYLRFSVSLVALALASPALAADYALEGDAAADDQETIIVTGRTEGYLTFETTSGTKTATPILDVPQSIAVMTETQIKDQAILTIADLVRYVPGVTSGQGEGHRDQITLRGNNSTADFFVDGLRDDIQYFRSFYNIDRVEVHKGPNAMIFGRGGGGGVLNRITKGSVLGDTFVNATASANTYGSWYIASDANADLGAAALRLNAFYEELDNHRDAYDGDHMGINPVVGAELGDVKVELGYEYVDDSRVVDRGIPSQNARPLIGHRDMFFGVRGINESDFDAHMVRFRSVASLTESLTFSTQALYGNYDKSYTNAYAATAVSAASTLGIEAYSDPTTRESVIAQGNLEWHGNTGSVSHIVLFGGEYTSQDTKNERINGFFDPVVTTAANRRRIVALVDPLIVPPIYFVSGPVGSGNRKVSSDLGQASVYIQDQIGLGEKFDLIAGIRYDSFDLSVTNRFTGQRFSRTDDLWSPRAGLVYKPVPEASIYVSYSKSYLPQSGDQFLSLDPTTEALKPESFDNYEVGAKWDLKSGLSVTAALYQLDRGNTRAPGATPGTTVLTGEQRSRGFEFGLTGRITPEWQTSIGYAYTDAEITETTSSAPKGRDIAQVPDHQLSLWNRYDVTDRLGLGLGLYHQSKQFASISNTTELPSYTRIDAAVFYTINERFDVQLNIENLTDETYYPFAHNDNNISTGAPLNARLTLTAKF